jgi:predicted enzyme related to lactoylglutathione lyase
MSPYKKVAFTTYAVTDLKKARDFYENILGIPVGDFGNDGFQEYDLGGTTFAIDSAPFPFLKPGSQCSLNLEVENVTVLVKTLKQRGVKILKMMDDDVMETPVCWMAFIEDLDGNIIGLHQLKAEA